jgi:CRP/FNR family transcriptional regulator
MPGRIADTLLYLSKEIFNCNTFEIPLTRQDIADMSAMTKESAIRILKELKDDKIIDFTASGFTILNEASLIQISVTG